MKRGLSFSLRCILLAFLSIYFSFQSQSLAQDRASKIDDLIQAYHDLDQFDGAVLVAMDGRVVFQRGYGLANREWDTPNTPDTKFRIASITKQITAMTVMILQEKGHLEVDDSVCDYVPDCPEAWNDITIHHLLTHTSGIPDFEDTIENAIHDRRRTTTKRNIERFKHKELMFPAGSEFSYSSSGYVLLGYIIERAAGTEYEKVIQDYIFDPLEMEDSGYDHPRTVLPKRASGYERAGQNVFNAGYLQMDAPHAAGALYSTVADLYLWDRALYTTRLVSRDALDTIFTKHARREKVWGYGYGWGIGELFGRRLFHHDGSINGFRAQLYRFPDDQVLIVSLSNCEGRGLTINESISAILFNEPYELPTN